MSAHLTRGRWPLLASLATAALITACGGGGDAPLPDSAYISWRNSANDVVIKDWNNESFAVRRDTGQVARYSDDLVLNGLTVVGTGVFINSGQIASVTYTTATNGSQITDFTCTNGRGLAITVTGSGSTAVWSWRCM